MSDRSTLVRRPLALGAALLVAAASFLVVAAGPVSAGRPLEFELTPATAVAGDFVAATSIVPCFDYEADTTTVDVWVLDAGDNEVFSTMGTLDAGFDWTATIDTTGFEAGEYTVEARCDYGPERYNNYQSETLTVSAAEATTTTEMMTTTTTEDMTSTTTTSAPTTPPAANQAANAAPAAAVAGSPSYTG